MQRNQHSGTERHKLSLIAGSEAALRDLGYSMNASRHPKPSSKRRNATPVIEGSIGEHCQAGGHTFTIYKWHRLKIKAGEQKFAVNPWACEAGNIDLAGRANRPTAPESSACAVKGVPPEDSGRSVIIVNRRK
jgi:hypothetical protein